MVYRAAIGRPYGGPGKTNFQNRMRHRRSIFLLFDSLYGRRGAQWAPVLPCAFRMAFPRPAILLPAGDHWSPVLPCAFRMAFRRPVILLPAGGRWPPLREGPICVDCFPEHRRGDHWSPVLPCAFRMAFRRPAILLPAGSRWPPLRGGPICAACIPEPPLRWVRVNKFSEPNAIHRATNLLYKAHPQPIWPGCFQYNLLLSNNRLHLL